MNRDHQKPICPRCGTSPLADDERCWNCNYPLELAGGPTAAVAFVRVGDSTPPATREGVWNPNGEGQQPDIPGGNAKDHARAKQPVIAYACLYPKLAAIAREHGYALAMHGSLVADCDLIAVPWVENAAPGDDLARALAVAAPGHLILDTYAARPGGVRKHVIHLGGGPYIDLAVCALGAVAPQGGEQC